MKSGCGWFLVPIVLFSAVGSCLAREPVGVPAVLAFDRLPYLRAGVRPGQVSSHDRSGGNDDGFNGTYSCLYQDGDEYVILDLAGPGCIYRMWFTGDIAGMGEIRFYIDGATTPTVSLPLTVLFAGTTPPFLSPLVEARAGGYYSYVPIPFRTGCKIATTGKPAPYYYNITYHRLDTDEGVESFSWSQDVSGLVAMWQNAGQDPKPTAGNHYIRGSVAVPAGQTVSLLQLAGAGSIRSIRILDSLNYGGTPTGAVSNPGFEAGILSPWAPYQTPAVVASSAGPLGPRSGSFMCVASSPGSPAVGCVYQRVSGLSVAVKYTASAWAAGGVAGGGSVRVRLGVHPTGVTNPLSPAVLWTPYEEWSADSEWTRLSASFTGGGTMATIFLWYELEPEAGTTRLDACFDDVDLVSGGKWGEEIWLKAYWDGEETPSVYAPLDMFFGSRIQPSLVESIPVGGKVSGDYYCYFPMPYWYGARLELENTGTQPLESVRYEIGYSNETYGPDAGHFCAKWRQEHPTTGGRDYTFLSETGRGHLVGVVHMMEGPTKRDYLEGDERFYVDGSGSPCLYGTGTEDYYNGGWYFSGQEPFSTPTHGAYHKVSGDVDRTCCYRFHFPDPIVFETGIEAGIEHGPVNEIGANYSSVAFYYHVDSDGLALTDELNVYDSTSEAEHNYTITDQTWAGWRAAGYEGDWDYIPVSDCGRAHRGVSAFDLAIDPDNKGVLLRRRTDQGMKRQRAGVWVDGEYVGAWYRSDYSMHKRWADEEFDIPASFTAGKDTIRVTIAFQSAEDSWNEYRYWAFSRLPEGALLVSETDSLASGWNMVSVPLEAPDADAAAVFDEVGVPSTAMLYGFFGTGYELYPGGFTLVEAGRGYWLRLYAPGGEEMAGRRTLEPVALLPGWNMIGPASPEPVAVADCLVHGPGGALPFAEAVAAGWLSGTLYRYDPGSGYATLGVDGTLEPWRGYWLKTFVEGLSLETP